MSDKVKWTNRGPYSMLREVQELLNSQHGVITSSDVAEKFGISRAQASTVMSRYARYGFLEEAGSEPTGRRPRRVYTVGQEWLKHLNRERVPGCSEPVRENRPSRWDSQAQTSTD